MTSTPTTTPQKSHWPMANSKSQKLLKALLSGQEVTPEWLVMEVNLITGHARISELRKLGWPITSQQRPHPKLPGEVWTIYYMTQKFRAWATLNPEAHPAEFPSEHGRLHVSAAKIAKEGEVLRKGKVT